MPTRKEWPEKMRAIAEERVGLSARKNANYSGGDEDTDAFQNFKLIEHVTHGKVSAEIGLLVRISDKFTRLANLLTGTPDLVGESIQDTLRDLSNYSDILLQLHRDRERFTSPEPPVADLEKEFWEEAIRGMQNVATSNYSGANKQTTGVMTNADPATAEAQKVQSAWQRLVDAMTGK